MEIVNTHSMHLMIPNCTHRQESLPTITEIQSTEQQPRLGLLITLSPTLRKEIPFRLELATKLASKSRINRCQEHRNTIISGCIRYSLVGSVAELQRRGLGTIIAEPLLRGLLSGRGARSEQKKGNERREETHRDGFSRAGFEKLKRLANWPVEVSR